MSVTSKETEVPLPRSVVLLKWLVILLTASMIGGVIAVVWLLVTRLPHMAQAPALPPVLPESLVLPQGVTPRAVTLGTGWIAVVGSDDHIHIFGTDGRPWSDIAITPPGP